MPAMPVARVTDKTNHGGTIIGPGSAKVKIKGLPAAVVGDNHSCIIPPNTGHIPISPFTKGSTKVKFGGQFALRQMDTCACGAMALSSLPTVMIG